jgi:hypothetical protein
MANAIRSYLNQKQIQFMEAAARVKVFIGGRGSGKTTVAGTCQYEKVIRMPKSKGFILGLTYNQILTKFLPPMLDQFHKLGLKEHIDSKNPGHYVIGKKPPSNWHTCYQPPRNYENTMTFFTGRCVEFLSFDRRNSTIGGNYDDAFFDEAVLIDKFRHDKELLPMIRGNVYRFPDNPLHHQRLYVSSQAWLPSGFWVPDMADLVDPEHPEEYFYVESTTHDNLHVLGKRYLANLEKELPFWTYQVEVMNKRLTRLPNGFYDEFDEKKHLYFDSFLYGQDKETGSLTTVGDRDYDPTKPLDISFDFGGTICCMTVHQEHALVNGIEERVLNCFHRKKTPGEQDGRSLITRLVDDFIETYKNHQHVLNIWGDRNGNNRQPNSNLSLYEEIKKKLNASKFNVVLKGKNVDHQHSLRHFAINEIFKEQTASLPRIRINQNKCKDLIISMQNAPVTSEFKKDKSNEHDKAVAPEHATHLSDCFDYYIYPKYGHLFGKRTRSTAPLEVIFN